METPPDYYARLGLLPGAEMIQIKSKYRALARKYHPDANPSPSAQDAFRAIQEAYDLLSDPESRAKYHRECALCGKTWAVDPDSEMDPVALAYEMSLLSRRLGSMGHDHLGNAAYQAHVLHRLNPEICALICAHPDQQARLDLIQVIWRGSQPLRYEDWLPLEGPLLQLTGGLDFWKERIQARTRARRIQHSWERRQPYLIIAASLILCILMFFWARHSYQ